MNYEQALQRMKDKGYKYTGKRADMIALFAKEDKYLSAKDILERMKDAYPTLSFDTIYRNLSLFVEIGILEQTELEGEKQFRFSCGIDHHHHHFICLECGVTKTLHVCPMDAIKKEYGDLEITGHKFEIYGKCDKCK
ncbi:MAG: Fur family transcriptional regulator [Bacillaceae bacterium]